MGAYIDPYNMQPGGLPNSPAPPPQFDPIGQQMGGMMGMAGMAIPFLQPFLQPYLDPHGINLYQFMPSQNIQEQIRRQKFYEMSRATAQMGVEADAQFLSQSVGGMFMMATGRRPVPAEQQQIQQMVGGAAQFLPVLSAFMGEGTVDALMGETGSRIMFNQAVTRGARFMTTPGGAPITDAQQFGDMQNEMFSQLYGSQSRIAGMRGVRGAEAGRLMEHMAFMGMLPSLGSESMTARMEAISTMGLGQDDIARLAMKDETIREMRSRGVSITQDDLRKAEGRVRTGFIDLQQTAISGDVQRFRELTDEDTLGGEVLRHFDAARMSSKLRDMSGAIAAMKEIFGEAGRPDAPMNEIIQALESMTGSSLAQMSPARLESMVRTTKTLAETTGYGIQGMQNLIQGTLQGTRALGLHDSFATDIANDAAMYTVGARGTLFAGGAPAWGGYTTPQQITQMDVQLRQNAANSPFANRAAALVRMQEEGLLDKDSEAYAIAEAIKNFKDTGDTTYTFGGKTRDIDMREDIFYQVTGAAGVEASLANQIERDFKGNQRLVSEQDTTGLARVSGGKLDIVPLLNQEFRADAMSRAKGAGISEDKGALLSARMAERVLNMPIDIANDPAQHHAYIMDAIKEEAAKVLTPQELRAFSTDDNIRKMASSMLSGANRAAVGTGYQGLAGMVQMHSQEAFKAQRKTQQDTDIRNKLDSATAGFGSTGVLARFMEAFKVATPETSIAEIIAKTAGGVSLRDAAESDAGLATFLSAMEMVDTAERDDTGAITAFGRKQAEQGIDIVGRLVSGDLDPAKLQAELIDIDEYKKQVAASGMTPKQQEAAIQRQLDLQEDLNEVVRDVKHGDTRTLEGRLHDADITRLSPIEAQRKSLYDSTEALKVIEADRVRKAGGEADTPEAKRIREAQAKVFMKEAGQLAIDLDTDKDLLFAGGKEALRLREELKKLETTAQAQATASGRPVQEVMEELILSQDNSALLDSMLKFRKGLLKPDTRTELTPQEKDQFNTLPDIRRPQKDDKFGELASPFSDETFVYSHKHKRYVPKSEMLPEVSGAGPRGESGYFKYGGASDESLELIALAKKQEKDKEAVSPEGRVAGNMEDYNRILGGLDSFEKLPTPKTTDPAKGTQPQQQAGPQKITMSGTLKVLPDNTVQIDGGGTMSPDAEHTP